ncbi:MAG: flagellar biosynthesis protein FlhB [Pseudomonadota bacterium]
MAQETDESQKTEAPTPKRIEDARRKGQVATSREVNNFMLLGAAAMIIAVVAPSMANQLAVLGRVFLAEPHAMSVGEASIGQALLQVLGTVGLVLAIPFAVFIIAALASSALQNSVVWTTEPMTPKLDKISPIAGFKRLFSGKSLFEFAKSVFKILVVGAVGAAVIWLERDWLLGATEFTSAQVLALTQDMALRLMIAITAIVAIFAAVDYAYQRMQLMKQLKMSLHEIKEEHKESDGDPLIKQRLRQLRNEKAQKRMMAAVPDATVVITNPTHFAVALRYEAGEMLVPEVVAKGVDSLALKIREVARENDVPVIENPPLARALHASVEIGETIPESQFKAVAEVISYVLTLRRPAKI